MHSRSIAAAAILTFTMCGVANASPAKCSSMYKELVSLQERAVAIQTSQAEQEEIFRIHDDARANARGELQNLSMNISSDFSREELEGMIAEHHEKAEAAKSTLNALNAEALEVSPAYKQKAESFNTECTS